MTDFSTGGSAGISISSVLMEARKGLPGSFRAGDSFRMAYYASRYFLLFSGQTCF
jgi:hypothetical protein